MAIEEEVLAHYREHKNFTKTAKHFHMSILRVKRYIASATLIEKRNVETRWGNQHTTNRSK